MLRAIREKLFEPGAFAEFCASFTEEMNRLRREHRVQMAAAPREIAAINRRSKEIMELLLQGFRDDAWKDELRQIEARRAELTATLAAADAAPPLPALHPQMAGVYRAKTEQLAAALGHEDDEQRDAARQAIRGFLDRIMIPPGDGLLQVVGKMLTAAGGRNGSAAVGYVGFGGAQPLWATRCTAWPPDPVGTRPPVLSVGTAPRNSENSFQRTALPAERSSSSIWLLNAFHRDCSSLS